MQPSGPHISFPDPTLKLQGCLGMRLAHIVAKLNIAAHGYGIA